MSIPYSVFTISMFNCITLQFTPDLTVWIQGIINTFNICRDKYHVLCYFAQDPVEEERGC